MLARSTGAIWAQETRRWKSQVLSLEGVLKTQKSERTACCVSTRVLDQFLLQRNRMKSLKPWSTHLRGLDKKHLPSKARCDKRSKVKIKWNPSINRWFEGWSLIVTSEGLTKRAYEDRDWVQSFKSPILLAVALSLNPEGFEGSILPTFELSNFRKFEGCVLRRCEDYSTQSSKWVWRNWPSSVWSIES